MIVDEDYLAHYGILRRSGRYPWGSGENIPQHNRKLIDHINAMKKQGLTEAQIAEGLDMSTTQLRAEKSIAKNQLKAADIAMAKGLQAKGMSNVAAAKRMGIPESSYRALLAPGAQDTHDALTSTAEMLRRHVDEKGLIDVGAGNENYLGVSQVRLNTAVEMLKAQGYEQYTIPVPQLGTGKDTKVKVLAPPGTTWGDAVRNRDQIQSIHEFSDDGGRSFTKIQPPLSINPRRVDINYAEDGGNKADGVLYIRPGVKDVSIGNSRYAQVRVQVGDGHYLKGMAVYKDDLPPGVDILFNTNKSNTGNKFDAMKKLSDDPDLPFGSIVRQITKDGKVTSSMNIVGVKETSGIEGGWDEWSKTLSSQMLSKQSPTLAKEQLGVTYDRRKKEYDEIMKLTNPTVKKKLLEEFAEGTDSAAVHLKAAHLPRQATKVILPINSLKETEVYAPSFRDGESVVLVRYPHGGTFEIPELTVNNRHAPAKKLLGDAKDAIGINHKVAERLSGADFDGDTVIVIPNNNRKIKTSPALERLKNFDPKSEYPPHHGMKTIDGGVYNATTKSVEYGPKGPSGRLKGIEMGKVSNLITDMTIRGASQEKIARAVAHSMVVIDAEKHSLDWKTSAQRNGIKDLTAEFQNPYRESGKPGASTLISRARSEVRLPELKDRPMKEGGPIDRVTGRKIMVPTGKTRLDKSGNKIPKLAKYDRLAITDDAHTLSSGTRTETVYAEHSNKLKSLANEARLSSLKTPRLTWSPSAKKTYSREVSSLNSKLALAEMNAPRERQAQIIAGARVRAKREANPNLEPETLKKIKSQELDDARIRVGAKKHQIVIEDNEWKAIQAGAISDNKLSKILDNADMDVVRKHATPRTQLLMTPSKTSRAQAMLDNGFTRAEVADRLGVSVSTLDASTNVEGG